MTSISKPALVQHAEIIVGEASSLIEVLSLHDCIGFELVATNVNFIIASVELPVHPEDDDSVDEDSVSYMMQHGIATIKLVPRYTIKIPLGQRLPGDLALLTWPSKDSMEMLCLLSILSYPIYWSEISFK